jgi:hypothetical protein
MSIDVLIAATLALLTIVMGYLGVHVTLHPADSPGAKLLYKVGFCACAVAAVALVVWQGIRNGKAQSGFQQSVVDAASSAKIASQRIDDLKKNIANLEQQQVSEAARRQQAERDLMMTTLGLQTETRKRTAQLAEQQKQQLDATKRQGLQTSLLRLSEVIFKLQTARDEWRKADNEARAKAGPRGRYDPVYTSERERLRDEYSRILFPLMQEAKSVHEQIQLSVPELRIGNNSRLDRATNGEAFPIEDLNRILTDLGVDYRRVATFLVPPPPE